MTPAEAIIATTFPEIPIMASILGDRVVLHTKTQSNATYILQNCDALLPPLELIQAPLPIYLHCSENNTYHEIGYDLMLMVSVINTTDV